MFFSTLSTNTLVNKKITVYHKKKVSKPFEDMSITSGKLKEKTGASYT